MGEGVFLWTPETPDTLQRGGGGALNMETKIKLACTLAHISEAELARRLDTTPQNFHKRLKVGKFTHEELEAIGKALGAEFRLEFIFPDGSKV